MTDAIMPRRAFVAACGAGVLATLAGCSKKKKESEKPLKVIMVTSTGGVADQPYNQLAWNGMQRLEAENGWEISYIAAEEGESPDLKANLTKAVEDEADIVWGIGYAMIDAINAVARENPDTRFAIIDSPNDDVTPNLTGVMFNAQESAFAVGYVAARVSGAGKVGFVGGVTSDIVSSFEYGYLAGILYGNKELGKEVTCASEYAENFGDVAKGKAIAQQMIKDGCDVIFHAAGGTGVGVLEACHEAGVWCIGVDQDQAEVFPEYTTIITSALKRIDEAIVHVSNELVEGNIANGTTVMLGAADDAIGIAATHDRLDEIDPDAYEDTLELIEKIKQGEIAVPYSQQTLEDYQAKL